MINHAIDGLRSRPSRSLMPHVDEDALSGLKFSDCLPSRVGIHVLQARSIDEFGIENILSKTVIVSRD